MSDMTDPDPLEPGSQIAFHPLHQPAREVAQVVELDPILRCDDEAAGAAL